MKKHSLSLLLAAALALPALSAGTAAAQDAGSPAARPDRPDGRRGGCDHAGRRGHGRRHHDPERRLARMTQELQLDENQVALVRQAMEQARSEHEALREQPRSEERRAQHRAIMERTAQRIDAVLTPAQRATFEQMRARHRERMERRMERRGQRGGGERGGAVDPRGI